MWKFITNLFSSPFGKSSDEWHPDPTLSPAANKLYRLFWIRETAKPGDQAAAAYDELVTRYDIPAAVELILSGKLDPMQIEMLMTYSSWHLGSCSLEHNARRALLHTELRKHYHNLPSLTQNTLDWYLRVHHY